MLGIFAGSDRAKLGRHRREPFGVRSRSRPRQILSTPRHDDTLDEHYGAQQLLPTFAAVYDCPALSISLARTRNPRQPTGRGTEAESSSSRQSAPSPCRDSAIVVAALA